MTDHETPKTCTRCKTEKVLSEFPRLNHTRDGHGSWCKSCVSDHNRESGNNVRLGRARRQRRREQKDAE